MAAYLAVINHKEAEVDPDAFQLFCDSFLDWFYSKKEYCWNYLNSTVRNYISKIIFICVESDQKK